MTETETSADPRYVAAQRWSEHLRALAHEEFPHGEVSSQIGIYDDDTFSVLVRHSHQHGPEGEQQTIHEEWRYRSEDDIAIRRTMTYPPGVPPYAGPESVESEPIGHRPSSDVEERDLGVKLPMLRERRIGEYISLGDSLIREHDAETWALRKTARGMNLVLSFDDDLVASTEAREGYTGKTSVTAHGNSPEAYVSRYALRRTVADGGDKIEWEVSEDGEQVIGTIVKPEADDE